MSSTATRKGRRRFPTAMYQSAAWRELRRRVLQDRGARCERCGHVPHVRYRRGRRIDDYNLHVHHKRTDGPFIDELKHYEVLCGPCHSEHHGGPKTTGLETPATSKWREFADQITEGPA